MGNRTELPDLNQMRKEKQYITILGACKAANIYVSPTDRQVIGKAWYGMYLIKRKKNKADYPWVGKAFESGYMARAYNIRFKSEIIAFIKNSLSILNK